MSGDHFVIPDACPPECLPLHGVPRGGRALVVPATLVLDGVPRLEMKVAGVPARLDHAYLEVEESGSVPSVNRVDLYGFALADGRPLKESFKPW